MWTCTKCNTAGNDPEDQFCPNCGQKQEAQSKSATASSAISPEPVTAPPVNSIKPIAQLAATAPVSMSIQPIIQTPSPLKYDESAFASQFPEWDLQPPAVMVRRVRRSI